LRPFSFVHVADLHLGYEQYNLAVRREDFDRAFHEVVEKTIELKPDFMIIAGDLFHHARPSNTTLEKAIKKFRRLKEAGIPVLAVEGSHDAAPNVITGTILNPLDAARQLPAFYEIKKPEPRPDVFNIFVFHMALDIPEIMKGHRGIIAEASPIYIPDGFNYYAGGHLHTPWQFPFKGALLVYSGSTETVSYEDAKIEKGFYHVEVTEKRDLEITRIKLETPRRFKILEKDYTGLSPQRVTELAAEMVKEADEPGAVIVPVLKGTLPVESTRREIDLSKVRNSAEEALIVRPLVLMKEKGIPEEMIRSIFEGEMKDLRTKSFEYFVEFFSQRYKRGEAEKNARLALDLIQLLVKGDEEKAKKLLEEAFNEN